MPVVYPDGGPGGPVDQPEPEPTAPLAVSNPVAAAQGTSPEQEVWNRSEKLARRIVRVPQRVGPGPREFTLFNPKDTSDQMVVDVTAQIVMGEFADQMHLRSELVKDIYARESEQIIAKAPETFLYAGTELLDANLTHTLGESLHWLSTQFGDDYISPWLSTYMITDSVSAAKTRALIEQIAMEDTGAFNVMVGGITKRAQASDLLQRILEDQLSFKDLSNNQQIAVQKFATEVRSQGEQLAETGTAAISRGLWVYASGDYGMVLDDADLEKIDRVIEYGDIVQAGHTSDLDDWQKELDSVGIDQIRAIDDGVLVLDEEWATENPDGLAAVSAYLEQRYPDVRIQVGRQGIVGSFLDAIGEPAEAVGAYVGAGLRQISEAVEAAGGDDRQKLLQQASYLRWKLDNGAVAEDQVDDTLYEIGRLEEDASSDIGWDAFMRETEQAKRNSITGGGFGELTTQSFGVMPGDTGYGAMVAAWTLFGQIAFDPTTYLIPLARGSSLARKFPLVKLAAEEVPDAATIARSMKASPEILKGLATAGMSEAQIARRIERVAAVQFKYLTKLADNGIPDAVHGILTRRVYGALAKTQDEWLGTRPYRNFVEGLFDTKKAIDDPPIFAAALARGGIDPERAVLLSQADNLDDFHLAYGSQMLPGPNSPVIADINAEINAITDQLNVGRANPTPAFLNIATDLEARKVWLESLKHPADVTITGMGLPNKRTLNRIINLGEATKKYNKPQYAMDVVTAALGDQRYGWRSRLFFSMNHLYEQAGTSREIFLTGPKQAESIAYLDEFARYMRIPDGRISELFAPWIGGKLDEQGRFNWFTDTFRNIIRESPTLNAAGKTELMGWYKSFEGPRIADYVNDADALKTPNPVLPMLNRATGKLSGRPATAAGELHGLSYRLPSAQSLRSYQTMLGRTLTRMEHANRVSRRISRITHGVGAMWYAFNDTWRTFMLATRPLGLAGRVTLEQQIRIAAYGYSGQFNHPIEWFRSLGPVSKMHANEFSLFTDSSEYTLGSFMDEFVKYHGDQLQAGVTVVPGNKHWVDAVAAKLSDFGTDPAFRRYFLKGLDDPDDWDSWDVGRAVSAFDDPENAIVADHWREVYEVQTQVGGVEPGLQGTWNSMREILGTGDDETMDWLRAMLVRRTASIDGVSYELGTKKFVDKLRTLEAEGRWSSRAKQIPLDTNLYARGDKAGSIRNVANAALRTGFTKPDIIASRHPMFAQVARREYNTLLGYGYDMNRAHRIASERAATIVANSLFELGVHTPGEVFWKNLNPFFPAWRELFTTWLLRIPMQLGGAENRGLSWALGATAMTRRISAGIEALTAGGFMEENPDGELVFKVFGKEVPVQSIAGIFPLPLNLMDKSKTWPQRLQGVAPTLGAPATTALGAAQWLVSDDSEMQNILDYVENWVAPYGTDTSLGPTAVDAAFEAFGIVPPWMAAPTREAHEAMRQSSVIDGMRIWLETHAKPQPPPEVTTAAERDEWTKTVLAPFYADQIAAGESYARAVYLRKAFMGTFLPFRMDSVNEGKRATEAMWADMALIRDLDIPGLSGRIINDFLTENPQLESYLTGKYLDERSNISAHEDIDTFFDAVQDGAIEIRSPIDWAVFNYGRTTINFMQRRISAEEQRLREVGKEGFSDYLLDPHAEDTLNELQQSLQNFRDWTATPESIVGRMFDGDHQTQTFDSMLKQYEKYRDERYGVEPSPLDTREERLLDVAGALGEFDRLVTLDPDGSDDWYKALDAVYKKLGDSPSDDWFDQARTWFFTEVTGKFYDRQRRLYDQIDVTDKGQQGPLYDRLRALAAEYDKPRTHNGVIFPTPEEYQFSRWTPREQRSKVADWAALPAFYLTEFQRKQVGYSIPIDKQEEANKLATFSSKANEALDDFADRQDRDPTDEERQKVANAIADRAADLGLEDYAREADRPTYHRISDALNLDTRNEGWRSIVTAADLINRYVEDAPYGEAESYRQFYFDWFVRQVDHAAAKDNGLDEILNEIEDGLADTVGTHGRGDVLRYVFFGWYPRRDDDFAAAKMSA